MGVKIQFGDERCMFTEARAIAESEHTTKLSCWWHISKIPIFRPSYRPHVNYIKKMKAISIITGLQLFPSQPVTADWQFHSWPDQSPPQLSMMIPATRSVKSGYI